MMKSAGQRIILAGLFALTGASAATAQVTVDIAKINCEQFFTLKTDPDALVVWLSGYYHAKNNSTMIDTQEFKDNVRMLRVACRNPSNFKTPVMQVIDAGA